MIVFHFVLLVGVLIFVHELGHFLFAKLFDVKVQKFSLGFGPRALAFRRGETEYCVSWFPLGGYVKMLGEDPGDEVRPEDRGRAFHQKPLWQRYIVVFAGPAFNLIFPTIIYFFFYAGQATLLPAVVGKAFGRPAVEAGLQPGDRIVAINGSRLRYWMELQRHIYDHPGEALKITIERDGKRFERYITPAEQVRQSRLGFKEHFGLLGITPYFEAAQVGISDPHSPAARAGLRTGDLITAVNGVPVERWAQLRRVLSRNHGQSMRVAYLRPGPTLSAFADLHLLRPRTTVVDPDSRDDKGVLRYYSGIFSAEFYIRYVEKGSPAHRIGMRDGDRVVAFDGQPATHWELIDLGLEAGRTQAGGATHQIEWVAFGGKAHLASFKLAREGFIDEYKHEQVRYVFGAHNRVIRKQADPVPIEGRFGYAMVESVRKTGEIVSVLAVVAVQIFRGAISSDTIGGPMMLAHTAHVAAKKGWDHFLWMMAMISINLGVINLLPIPILDGGHIMFFTVQAIKRRPLSLRAREIASYVGLFLLISLMVLAMKNDIVRYLFK